MNKKGFAFIESVIVLVMVSLSITMVYSSFSLISSKSKEKEYYDKASDKYLLLSLSGLGINENCNYTNTESCGIEGINFQADENNCTDTRMGKILYNCGKVFEDMDMKYLYVVNDIQEELKSSDAVNKYDNGVIQYMKTLKKCSDKECTEPISYMIGVFYRSGNYYYASIEIEETQSKNKYNITFSKEGGSGGSEQVEVIEEELLPRINIPSKENYTFEGYYTERNGEGTKYYDSKGNPLKIYEGDSDITLYANWVQTLYTFNYKNSAYEFIVPMDGTYKIELWGAQGGETRSENSSTIDSEGGKGAYTKGEITLTKGTTLYVYVGENKNMPDTSSFNAGTSSNGGYTGGGATDIRLTNGEWNNFNSLKSRIMVAAGGGSGVDGYGGGLVGGVGKVSVDSYRSEAATQTTPGITKQTTYCINGKFGIGGNCAAGGGGYYGGAGSFWAYGGGSGGSSFISGHPGCKAITSTSTENSITHTDSPNHYSGKVFTNTQMIAGNGIMPKPTGGTETGHTGSGYARITILNGMEVKYKVTLNKESGTEGSEEVEVIKGELLPRINIPSKENYTFEGYYTGRNGEGTKYYDSKGNPLKIYEGDSDITLYANWVQTLYTFNYKNSAYEFIVPMDGTYKIELWGAQGGETRSENSSTIDSEGGKGAYTKGEITLTKGTTLYVYVGENKNMPDTSSFNAGTSSNGGYTGGGATDIRLTNGEWNNFNSLKSRIMVAAGGGSGVDGYGGGLVGGVGKVSVDSYRSEAATQTTPGITKQTTYCINGKFGIGGNCAAGGGGYYGGAGSFWAYGGGSGGSSFISGHPGCKAITSTSTENSITHTDSPNHYSGKVFTNTQMIAGNGIMPKPTGGTETGHTGSGYARITIIN